MTRRRWIADQMSGDKAFLLGKNAEHLSRVLRAQIGQQFEIATPAGVRLGTIVAVRPDKITLSLSETLQTKDAQSQIAIQLYLAVFKFDRFEWAVEKCTELGVSSIIPLIAQRTDAHLAKASQKRVERWQRIAHEAAQQSRRDGLPEIQDPEKLEQAISTANGQTVVLAESGRERRLIDLKNVSTWSLAIGPEGGWTESELALFREAGWTFASLGQTILRAETAAISAVAIVQALASKAGF
jgi:16S rRNA (uracil1498-N3)-methyltransferase